MKKLSLSKIDIGYIVAFLVVGLLGGGAWWFLSGQLQDAQSAVTDAKAKFDKFSTDTKYHVVVNAGNIKTLQGNIDLIKSQLDPLVPTKLQPKDNKLQTVSADKEDPVTWKHDLDDDVHGLTDLAKTHAVTLPPNFYFGFSRYLSQSPNDEQTTVLSKQLLGTKELATILINAPVKSISSFQRTYEEDPHTNQGAGGSEPDRLQGFAFTSAGNSYTAYPFEVEFVTTAEELRPVLNNLLQSPYIFVVRSLNVENSVLNSPKLDSLDALAGGSPAGSVVGSSPGDVASTASTKGPQYLFGNSDIKVKARIDLIEWTADLSDSAVGPGGPHKNTPSSGAK